MYWTVKAGRTRENNELIHFGNRADNWADNWVDNGTDNGADNRVDNWADNRADNRAGNRADDLADIPRFLEISEKYIKISFIIATCVNLC